MIDELTDYLDREAERVRVHDTLDDIEAGVTRVAVAPERRGSRWLAPALVGAAAAAVVLFGVTATNRPAPQQAAVPGAALGVAPPAEDQDAAAGADADQDAAAADPGAADQDATAADGAATPVPIDTSPVTPQPLRIPLPDGATLQGLTPSCTTDDGIEFDCIVEEDYRWASGWYNEMDNTGATQAVISADEIVIGGCRGTSPDGSTWHCAIGQRAVELDMVGPNFLGAWAPPGYAHG